jgi:YD repeat-containing protein
VSDRNGNTTTYAYDGAGKLLTITDPAGQVTTLGYQDTLLATVTDPAGRITQLSHDAAGNLTAINFADQTTTTFQYDAQHHLVERHDARGQVYAYQYDSFGRLKKAVLPNSESRELRATELAGLPDLAAGQGTSGNPAPLSQPPVIQATFTDARGNTSTFETDAIGRVTLQKGRKEKGSGVFS